MANPQIASHEARIGAPAAMIEANIATPLYRGEPAPHQEQRLGWREYVGTEGRVIARYDFGASASIKDLLTHFGFAAEHVASEARSFIKR